MEQNDNETTPVNQSKDIEFKKSVTNSFDNSSNKSSNESESFEESEQSSVFSEEEPQESLKKE